MTPRSLRFCLVFSAFAGASCARAAELGNAFKVGEVDATSAIVWTRITASTEFNRQGVPFSDEDEAVPAGRLLSEMRYSLMAAHGEARVGYAPKGEPALGRWTPWVPARADRDGTLQFELHGLSAGTAYEVEVQARPPGADRPSAVVRGGFETALAPDQDGPVDFAVVTCHDFIRRDDPANGHFIYRALSRSDPDFLVHAGDVEYYDKPGPYAKNAGLARYKWNRLFALPYQRDFYRSATAYFLKDDHDILMNDAWPGMTYGDLTWDEGLRIFREQTPSGPLPYRTFRWGKHLQIWLMEAREYRSPNDTPDGPGKTLWGETQKRWFFETFAASDATFRIVISPTPILGPDRPRKNDNHANDGFEHEGREIRDFLASQEDAFVICGDRHWQYASVDGMRGIREYGCGAGADAHAGGWREDMRTPGQTFLRIAGGYLQVAIRPSADGVRVHLRHCDVHGNVVNEETLVAQRAGVREETADGGEGGWTALFDRTTADLNAFRLFGVPGAAPERWSIMGEVLTLASRGESPGKRAKEDLILTSRGYRDFELEFDWKAAPGANGGVFYKVVEDPRFDKPWHTGLEYQLLDDEGHVEGRVDTHRAGDLYDLIASETRAARPALSWNRSRLVVKGTRFEHWLNGVRIVAGDTSTPGWAALAARSKYRDLPAFARPVEGLIVLQDHGDRMWFKNIRIREGSP